MEAELAFHHATGAAVPVEMQWGWWEGFGPVLRQKVSSLK